MCDDISLFEKIRRTIKEGGEVWSSRDFAKALGYTSYQNFEQVIAKAKTDQDGLRQQWPAARGSFQRSH